MLTASRWAPVLTAPCRPPFDATGMPLLTQALLEAGLSREDIAKVMGGNVIRLLEEALPSENDTAYPDKTAAP